MSHGDLVPGRADITLEGWQSEPQLRWSFQHVAEMFPTAAIAASARPTGLPERPADLDDLRVRHPLTGGEETVRSIIDASDTDAWAVLHQGHLAREHYQRGMSPSSQHLLMSVSKSLVGAVAAALVDRGLLAVDEQVTHYVPALAGTGYAGATVRHLLDMRSGIRFSEEYTDPNAEVRLLEQAIGWAPRRTAWVPDSMYGFLATLTRAREHGGAFEYRSCETDVLGWVCESAAGARMAGLLSDLVWRPMGAEHAASLAVDHEGSGMFDGGISASLRDLLRFGAVWLGDGTALDGTQVIGPNWVEETLRGDVDSDAAFAGSKDGPWMPGGMYRNQMWFPSPRRDTLVCLGIHGQMVYVNRTAGVVAAKLSSWPDPQDPRKLFSTLAAFDAVATALGG